MEKEQLISLVTKAQQGDQDALNSLFNAYYNDLYYFALKTVKDDELALDITQDAFVEIINTLADLREPVAFVTWAKQITYHKCTRYFKKKKDIIVDEDEDGNTVFDTLQEESAEFIPDEALDQNDFKKTILLILDELPEEQRAAVMMYYFDEMSVREIAEIQGVSEGTVKSRLNYARKAIKEAVEEYEKKNNIKLHAIPFFPFFGWLFKGSFEGGLSTASAQIIAEGVTAATGTTVTVGASAAATVATTTTAATVGIAAKIAAIPLVVKIIAASVAAAIVVGGATTAVILNNNNNDNDKNNNVSNVVQGELNNEQEEELLAPQRREELLLGEYEGTYVDNQMKENYGDDYDCTPLKVTVFKDGEAYRAIFAYHDLPNLMYPSGKYCYNISYDVATGEYVFTEASDMEYADAGVYLEKPVLYYTPEFRGKLIGDVLSGETPTKFSVTRISDPNGELVLQGTIPEGCTYTLTDGTILTAGQAFPPKCTAGDVVKYGDYIYGYECVYNDLEDGSGEWHLWKDVFDSGDSGMVKTDVFESWSVVATDKSKQSYGVVAAQINGKPIKTLYATYYDCKQMVKAPRIPSTITAMTATYYGCSSLATAPLIPSNVQRIMVTFFGCKALTGNVEINATLDKSLEWFYSDTFGLTTGKINLVGATPEEDLILIARASDNPNITVNGKSVADVVQGDSNITQEDSKIPQEDLKVTMDDYAADVAVDYISRLLFSNLPYFTSADELTPSNAFWFILHGLDLDKYYSLTFDDGTTREDYYQIPISVLTSESNNIFGTDYDFSSINEYSPFAGTYEAKYVVNDNGEDYIHITAQGGAGTDYHPEFIEISEITDGICVADIAWYGASSEKPTDENADYYCDEYGTYWIADKWEKMKLQIVSEKVDGRTYIRVRIVSYYER